MIRQLNIQIPVLPVLMVSCCLLLFSCRPKASNRLRIATAANMQFAMKEVIRTFTEQTGIACEMVVGSSGKLTAQIKEGAPYDIFASANMLYPTKLFNDGFTVAAPRVYAYGRLVIWSMVDGIQPDIGLCTEAQINHIALANPATAPYGAASIAVLKHYGIFDRIQDKLVYGESIAQTNQFIISQTAEVGFTAKSVVLSPEMRGKGQWKELAPGLHPAIAQGVVLLKNREPITHEAQQFYTFLFSGKAKEILTKFGYTVQ